MVSSRRDFLSGLIAGSSSLALGALGCDCASQRRRPAVEPSAATAPKPHPPARVDERTFLPSYLKLEERGLLAEREKKLWRMLARCRCCPRGCEIERLAGDTGVCSATARLKLNSAGPHHGEERPLSGERGSGTIFFSHCNLLCCYCQNWEIAHRGDGEFCSHEQLANVMLGLQRHGCHNINLVTPSHVVPHIIKALRLAIPRGLRLPLVYNTSSYDSLQVLRLLDGIVDIYLPDYKYMDGKLAAKYSKGAADYPKVAAAAIKEMHRQVGDLVTDAAGTARRGVMLRHLVLPHNIAGTDRFVRWVARELSPRTYVNVMAQYHPAHEAYKHPALARRTTAAEWRQAVRWAREAGLQQLDT